MNQTLTDAPLLAPTTLAEVQECVLSTPRLLPRGHGTKPGLSAPPDGAAALTLTGLNGIQEYDPGEYTITALAGTPVAHVAAALAEHGQYLPFDPPLVRAGATLGGTVAAGLSGSGRYRYGGLRDFLIGVRLVDGSGRLIRGGGKVVKNAAGFDLPKLMIGSIGRLAVLVEITFKVFPAPPAYATLRADFASVAEAAAAIANLRLDSFDLLALDLVPTTDGGGTLLARIGGPASVLQVRLEKLHGQLGRGTILAADQDQTLWQEVAEFAWVPNNMALVKAPLTPHQLLPFDQRLAAFGTPRRYIAGSSLAWIAWSGSLLDLSTLLASAGLSGLVLWGHTAQSLIGAHQDAIFRDRIVAALDPQQRFLPFERNVTA